MKLDNTIETRLFIHGRFVRSVTGKTFPVISPATNEVVADVFEAGEEDVDRAVQSAKEALPAWACIDGTKKSKLCVVNI